MDFKMEECAGCTTCEMACSYKHTKAFNNRVSSIEIIETKEEPGYMVRLIEEGSGERLACDGCVEILDDYPWCVRYCSHKDELMDIVKSFREKCLGQKGVD